MNKEYEKLTTMQHENNSNIEKYKAIISKQGKLIEMLRNTVNDDKIIIKTQEEDINLYQEELNKLKFATEEILHNFEQEKIKANELDKKVKELKLINEELREKNETFNEELETISELKNKKSKKISSLIKTANTPKKHK